MSLPPSRLRALPLPIYRETTKWRSRNRKCSVMHGHDMSQPWFTQWNWNPIILVSIAVLIGLYCYGIIFLRRNYQAEEHAHRGQIVAFASAMVALFAALISPLDMLAEMLFTGHMIQHLILSLVVSPLLVLATPPKIASLLLQPRP